MIMKIFKTVEREFQYNNSKVRDIVFVCCNNCNQEFSRTKRALDIAFKRGLKVYCSKDCELESKTVRKIAECQECGKQTSNKFCSRSCSATYHNRERRKLPRVKKQKATIKREPKELKKRVCKCGKIDYTRTRFISETCSFCSTGMMYRLLCTFKFNLKDYPDGVIHFYYQGTRIQKISALISISTVILSLLLIIIDKYKLIAKLFNKKV